MDKAVKKHDWTLSAEQFCRLVNNIAYILYSAAFTDSVHLDFVSKKAESITGYTADEIMANKSGWLELIHSYDKQKIINAYERCKRLAKGSEVEYRVVRKDGVICEVLDRMEPVFNDRGEVVGLDGLIIDITEQKRAMRELDRTQMLQNIGKLGAGIAHEINTPIQFIGDNMRFLSDVFEQIISLLETYKNFREQVSDGDYSEQSLEKVMTAEADANLNFLISEVPLAIDQSLEGVKRLLTIVAAMRDFSHIDDRRMGLADLNKALESTVVIMRNELKYVAEVKLELYKDLPLVFCCEDDMKQVFLNLLSNAAHSIEQKVTDKPGSKGEITIITRHEGRDAVISISDTGTGIGPEIRDKIFDPFFTTKQSDRGTGQGLSIVRSVIVEKHGGKIDLDTEPGVGTTFTIYLPIEGKQQKN